MIRSLLINLDKVKTAAEAGNATAAAIYIDIEDALTILTERQSKCIDLVLLQSYVMYEAGNMLNIPTSTVSWIVSAALHKMSDYFLTT